jgi:uncharacterized integral membrane protein
MVERERVDAPDTDQIPVQTNVPTEEQGTTTTPAGEGTNPGGTPSTPAGRHASPGPDTMADPAAPSAPTSPGGTIAPSGEPAYRQVRRTRFSGLWVGATVAAVVLLVLLVFIIENSQTVNISFFGAHGHLSLGVALLLAAICGVLLVAVPGYGRILQLRKALRHSGVGKTGGGKTGGRAAAGRPDTP